MCILCGRTCKSGLIGVSDCIFYECPSCGRYAVSNEDRMSQINDESKIRLSQLLAEYRLKKTAPILLTFSHDGKFFDEFIWKYYKDFLKEYPGDALEIIDRSLLNLSRMVTHPSD